MSLSIYDMMIIKNRKKKGRSRCTVVNTAQSQYPSLATLPGEYLIIQERRGTKAFPIFPFPIPSSIYPGIEMFASR
jgi:hypothetical protein